MCASVIVTKLLNFTEHPPPQGIWLMVSDIWVVSSTTTHLQNKLITNEFADLRRGFQTTVDRSTRKIMKIMLFLSTNE